MEKIKVMVRCCQPRSIEWGTQRRLLRVLGSYHPYRERSYEDSKRAMDWIYIAGMARLKLTRKTNILQQLGFTSILLAIDLLLWKLDCEIADTERRLHAFEMKCLWRISKISYGEIRQADYQMT